MALSPPLIVPRPVMTVHGPIPYEQLGITDAHNHIWIEAVPGASQDSPVLDQYDLIYKELFEFRQQGGGTILDCQPGGCGRNGNKLLELSLESQINVLACTGFHRQKYYSQNDWLWDASAQKVSEYICSELEHGLMETLDTASPVRAGFIKIALESSWAECPQAAMEGTVSAAHKTKALLEIHTEKGSLAEKACVYFTDQGLQPQQLVFCHMDKRPDISLHQALARFGVLLEYDTFYRPKYNPATNLWPLIEQMVGAGLSDRIALATDMAESTLYKHMGGGPGLASLPGEIRDILKQKGIPEAAIAQMLGGNIARRLAGIL
jgi:predicted metal-dependent phosphotriesterase family hydrolase